MADAQAHRHRRRRHHRARGGPRGGARGRESGRAGRRHGARAVAALRRQPRHRARRRLPPRRRTRLLGRRPSRTRRRSRASSASGTRSSARNPAEPALLHRLGAAGSTRCPRGSCSACRRSSGRWCATRLFSWARQGCAWRSSRFVPARRFEGDDDESIGDFATRRLGREAAERLVAPLLGGISAGDASDISVRAAFPQLVAHGARSTGRSCAGCAAPRAKARARAAAERSAFTRSPGGVGDARRRARRAAPRRTGATLRERAAVEAIAARRAPGRCDARRAASRVDADAVLLAVPGLRRRARWWPASTTRPRARCVDLGYGSTATVFLGYRRADVAHPLDGVGFVVPRAAGRPILAGTWVSSKWEGRAPEGHVLVRVVPRRRRRRPRLLGGGDDGARRDGARASSARSWGSRPSRR